MSEPRGVLIGLDHGTKVIGLALCDASWIVTRPLGLWERKTREADFAHLRRVITTHNAVGVVVGLPYTPPDFSGTSQADTVRRWASRLAAALIAPYVPVYLWDERLSTFEAEEQARDLGAASGSRPPARLDDQAAAVILQDFIDHHHDAPLPPPVKRPPSED